MDSQEIERDFQAVIDLSHRRGRECCQDTKDIALLHRQQVRCDERRFPGEPTAWRSRRLDQVLRGRIYPGGFAGDLGDDRVRRPSVVSVILNSQSGTHLNATHREWVIDQHDVAAIQLHLRGPKTL